MKRLILSSISVITCLLAGGILVAQTPVITSFTPENGPPGTIVTITGSGFNPAIAGNTVFFGPIRGNVNAATSTSLSVTVPAGASYHPVNVKNNTSNLIGYSRLPFTPTFSGCKPIDNSSFSAPATHTAGTTTRSVIFSDLDNDGRADMIATNNATNNISVFRNTSTTGSPAFSSKIDFAAGVAASGINTGDLNGDGMLDIVVSNYNTMDISIFINTTTGSTISFAGRIDIATWDVLPGTGYVNPLGVVIQDLNGDGKVDIGVANFVMTTIALYRNTTVGSTPSFVREMITSGLNGPRELAIGDMDADGKPDMVVVNETGASVLVYRNTSPTGGAFTFAAPVVSATASLPRGVALGDLDRDGKLDIALVNSGSSSVSVYRNTSVPGTITISAKTDYTVGVSPRELSIADLDGDGRPEIAASSNHATASSLSVLRNTSSSGSISYATMASFPAGNNALGTALQDVDNDGKVDVALTSNSGGYVGVYRNITPVSTLSGIIPISLFTTSVCDNSTWKTVYDGLTHNVVASVRYNANNLGAINSNVYVNPLPGLLPSGKRYLARHFVIRSATPPSTPVQVRLYITNVELLALSLLDPTINSISDINVTNYSGPTEDGTYSTSDGTVSFIPAASITTGTAFGAHYLEFTTTSLGEFWLHGGYVVLDTKLLSFTAHNNPDDILLKWKMSTDHHADHFAVEKSRDGANFETISRTVTENASENEYAYRDNSPAVGNNYYRLQIISRGGRKTTSKVLLVNRGTHEGITVSMAYLTSRYIRISISGKAIKGRLIVYDSGGRPVETQPVHTTSANTSINVRLDGLACGVYAYQLVASDGYKMQGKIILQ